MCPPGSSRAGFLVTHGTNQLGRRSGAQCSAHHDLKALKACPARGCGGLSNHPCSASSSGTRHLYHEYSVVTSSLHLDDGRWTMPCGGTWRTWSCPRTRVHLPPEADSEQRDGNSKTSTTPMRRLLPRRTPLPGTDCAQSPHRQAVLSLPNARGLVQWPKDPRRPRESVSKPAQRTL